ncbi:DUF2235 domain-containing protein [Bradyrhizobium sp. CCGE-LA001]|uniref:DUF2235 domain-containing protein n=1 Tax=Bradyrhizobium sp. CCGE-LA001 TaxID=1223566 RepID=UPI0002AA7902|nr:DUF2235 domain-containing protein [Bradyrhizobium sp. CCGE-LA001]AMA60590.1 hypothetical protein BCCGELA001_33200 [Bradyrhizobium sp. CCGE-LA001]
MTDIAAGSPVLPLGRKFVIFADGTGNAFSAQESNVWRLYEALDRTKTDQVAYYIKGVGTAGWKPFALFDGVTGVGVPSNVRTLYRFLSWNWQPGDHVYIFGFSRGAFTARTLAGMIAAQGLMPAMIDGKSVSHADMARNTKAAWRAYRSASVTWRNVWPTVTLARVVRDVLLWIWQETGGRLLGHQRYSDVLDKRKEQDDKLTDSGVNSESRRDNVHIEFLGLFDTVEAFGVPIEELRVAIDYVIWPISFRNGKPSPKVKRVRHALSLDDERETFHPLRFEREVIKDPDGKESISPAEQERIKEVWFAGVHSDVGGGYPDGNLSYVPMTWMASQVEGQLRFQDGRIDYFRAYQSAIGPVHDSRAGAAVFYRYSPRGIASDLKDGGPPVLHHSVVQRMLKGCDNYAPVTLPAKSLVWLPGPTGATAELILPPEKRARVRWQPAANATQARRDNAAAGEAAIDQLPPPSETIVERTLDTVWWRRVSYFWLLALAAVALAWPVLAPKLVAVLRGLAVLAGLGGVFEQLEEGNDRSVRVLAVPFDLLQAFLPSAAAAWLETARTYPLLTLLLATFIFFAYQWSTSLRDRIRERARLAWYHPERIVAGKERETCEAAREHAGRRSFAREMRNCHLANGLAMLVSTWVFPGVLLTALFGSVFVAGNRSLFDWYAGRSTPMCVTAGEFVVDETPKQAGKLFETSAMCWGSGLWIEKGRQYRLSMKVVEPWFDRTTMSGTNGFTTSLFTSHGLGLASRRWYHADWFQPIARVGKWGTSEWPLVANNKRPADELPRKAAPALMQELPSRFAYAPSPETVANNGNKDCRLIPTDKIDASKMDDAKQEWDAQNLAREFVADFIAPESGELFLYVNDAIQIVPFLGPYGCYYSNNRGTAQVTLQRLPASPVAPAPPN